MNLTTTAARWISIAEMIGKNVTQVNGDTVYVGKYLSKYDEQFNPEKKAHQMRWVRDYLTRNGYDFTIRWFADKRVYAAAIKKGDLYFQTESAYFDQAFFGTVEKLANKLKSMADSRLPVITGPFPP